LVPILYSLSHRGVPRSGSNHFHGHCSEAFHQILLHSSRAEKNKPRGANAADLSPIESLPVCGIDGELSGSLIRPPLSPATIDPWESTTKRSRVSQTWRWKNKLKIICILTASVSYRVLTYRTSGVGILHNCEAAFASCFVYQSHVDTANSSDSECSHSCQPGSCASHGTGAAISVSVLSRSPQGCTCPSFPCS